MTPLAYLPLRPNTRANNQSMRSRVFSPFLRFTGVFLPLLLQLTGSPAIAVDPTTEPVAVPLLNLEPTAEPLIRTDQEVLYERLVEAAHRVDPDVVGTLTAHRIHAGWWQDLIPRSLRADAEDVTISLDQALYEALAHSDQIKVSRLLPPIRRTAIVEARAAFDTQAFMDTQWDDTSDPIGSTLTAGAGVSRFRDHYLRGTAGLRRKTSSGGQLELSQMLGHQDNNSNFFVPVPQGSSRITLSFTQPLMRGRGKTYNRSLICLAEIDHGSAHDELMRQLQAHLMEVSRAYWAIYYERGVLYQKLQTYDRAKKIVERLGMRRSIDAPLAQIQSAEAALSTRRSELIRAVTAVKNAEARLRALVNSPSWGADDQTELLPLDVPSFSIIPVDMAASRAEALKHRPEIRQALKSIKAASIRAGMARHEIMPVLNLVTSTYVAGLAGNGAAGIAWERQFTQGEPSYSLGLQYEVALGNRASKARLERRQLELQQLRNQYQATLNTVNLEVTTAIREVQTAQQELFSRQHEVQARETQLDQIVRRWETLPSDGTTTSLVLENILQSQVALATAESEYLRAQVTHSVSAINLRKATGTLLRHDN